MPAVVEQRISAELSEDLRTRWAPAVAADLELQEGGPDEMPGRTSTSRPRVVGAWATHPQRTALRAGGGGGGSSSLTSVSEAARGRVRAAPHEP